MAVISMTTAFTSCKKKDTVVDPPPVVKTVITVTSPTDGASQISGTGFVLAFGANSDNGLKRVVVKFKSATGIETTKFDTALTAQPTSFNFSRNYIVGSVGTETYTISVTDKKDNIETKSINVKSITGFANEAFGKFYHILGSYAGAYDLDKSVERSIADADADKDMSNNDAAGVFTGGWEAKNSTMYVKSSTFNYTNGTSYDAKNDYAAGTPSNKVTTPVNGDIYIAKLRGVDTYIVIKIIANETLNNECGCSNKGKLSFNFKRTL